MKFDLSGVMILKVEQFPWKFSGREGTAYKVRVLYEGSVFTAKADNGEYSKDRDDHILADNKTVYRLKTGKKKGDQYPIAKEQIEKLELLSILLDATEKTQQPFLHRAIDTEWFSKNNQNFEKEVKSITQKLNVVLSKKDKNFSVPFLKKLVKDFENLGFKVLNSGKSFDDLKYNATTSGYYFTNGTSPSITKSSLCNSSTKTLFSRVK